MVCDGYCGMRVFGCVRRCYVSLLTVSLCYGLLAVMCAVAVIGVSLTFYLQLMLVGWLIYSHFDSRVVLLYVFVVLCGALTLCVILVLFCRCWVLG